MMRTPVKKKISKVAGALNKASKKHAAQAKVLKGLVNGKKRTSKRNR
jgi:hypothetical protein